MDFSITKEQLQYQQEVIDFANNILNQNSDKESFSKELWDKSADFGLFGVTIGEEYGGLGESNLTAAIMFKALGYACDNNGFTFAVNNHIWVCENMIFLYGSLKLKDKYIRDMVLGKRIGAIAITEADSGSDALSMQTVAKEDGDYFTLNGSKMFISNGPIADLFLVIAVTDIGENNMFSALVVEKHFEGVEVGPDIERMGLGGCPMSEISFHNCRVPKENVLGHVNMGNMIMLAALEWERFYEFVPHVGKMKKLMETCLTHVNERKQFGHKLGDYQAISHKIAEMQVSIEMAETMLYKIAWLKDNKKPAFMETSIFKLYVSENYIKASREAVQIFGAYGYTKEYPVEREFRDAIACSIYSGTNEVQKNNIYNLVSMQNPIKR